MDKAKKRGWISISFGENLAGFRKRCGLTQVQLAQILNVTPQAVSKWEKGSYPDSELLPSISSALGVSIDSLFGVDEVFSEIDIELIINKIIRQTPENERADLIMKIFYSAMGAFTKYKKSKIHYPENLELETYGEIKTDYEMALARLNEDLKYFCFVKVPEEGLYPYVKNTEMMATIFETLADPDTLKLIYYLGSGRRDRLQSLDYLTRHLDILPEKLKYIVDRLDRLGIMWRVAVDDSEEASIVYGYGNSTALTVMLILAQSLSRYIQFLDCNIDNWQHGPFRMPNTSNNKPVPEVSLWCEEKNNFQEE